MKKKIILILTFMLLLTGCMKETPSKKVEEFLNKYQNLNASVLTDLEFASETENISENFKKIYNDIFMRVYGNLTYKIENEKINGEEATVAVNITVYDLYKVRKESMSYMQENIETFSDENGYNDDLFLEYELNQMLNTNDTIDYTIYINLEKMDDEWHIKDLDNETKEKIHGIYNYEND